MKKYSFCGVSGSGMSAIAQVLKWQGNAVRGSDRSFDNGNDKDVKSTLESLGIEIFPQDGSAITDDVDCLVVSSAVEDSIPDVKAAIDKNIKIKKRSDILAEIFHNYENSIAVGGTSGKTTVTAMVGHILRKLNQNPCIIDGGIMVNILKESKGLGNAYYKEGENCVVEVDESDGSIEKFIPKVALVNNITHDHKPVEELKVLFSNFVSRAKLGAVVNLDCEYSKELLDIRNEILTFSIESDDADFYAYDIKPLPGGVEYYLDGERFELKLTGRFNISNALAAIASVSILGLDRYQAAKALEDFLGTKRRLELIGEKNNITVIDDFAHNPDKIAASLSALLDYEGRLLIMFQPHGYAPMRMMGNDIAKVFYDNLKDEDILIMPEIYFAGGTVTKDISSKDFTNLVKKKGKNAVFCENREAVEEYILENAKSGDRVIIMGARDNTLTSFAKNILEKI